MCNLYNITTHQEAILALKKAIDRLGNLEPSLNVYPDQVAPISARGESAPAPASG